MNKLLILTNIFYQTIQCNVFNNNLNNNFFLGGGSAVYNFDKFYIGGSVQTNGYLSIVFCGGDIFFKIYNRNVNVFILGNFL